MLSFYETYQKYDVPASLGEQILNPNGESLKTIENINKVNIFIGANNSGKSKILRELLKQGLVNYYGEKNWNRITSLINDFFTLVFSKLREAYNTSNNFSISNSSNGQIYSTVEINNIRSKFLTYSSNYDLSTVIDYIKHQFITLPSSLNRSPSYYISESNSSRLTLEFEKINFLFTKLNEITQAATEVIEGLSVLDISQFSKDRVPKIYIPSIRTLRAFGADADVEKQTRGEYQLPETVEIYNGQNLPSEVLKLKTTGFNRRQKIIEFEELLSKEFFESKKVTLTYDTDIKVLLIKIGDETERPIHELGDGIQMIIILTFPFYSNFSGIIVIEEPELFIHPGLQKTFIKFLISNKATENFQVFMATHSNHIIDSINSSNLVSLFSVRKRENPNDKSIEKTPNFILENLAFGNNNLLTQLGITTTSVYLSNCTIWVEGITDRIYIQKFILEYLSSVGKDSQYFNCIEYQEGINYSFALTAGDSIMHWDFSEDSEYLENTKQVLVSKFCSKSMVIVDNDFGKNRKRKELLSEILKERLVELPVPEIENLLPEIVVKKTILEYPSVSKVVEEGELPPLDSRVFYKKKIGGIIDEVLLKNYPNVKTFASKKGKNSSLKSSDKFDFCNKATNYITKTNLTTESINLVEKILDFIISRNGK